MRRILLCMLAAILMSGASVFTSCTNDDNPVLPDPVKIIDLATITEAYTAQDGETLTGLLPKDGSIYVADGASITLKDVVINPNSEYDTQDCAGINCLGDATITLEGKNVIKSLGYSYPALFVPEGYTLTIQGDGSLDASACGEYDKLCPAIGSCRVVASCGNLVFLGGVIKVEGGFDSAAIGAGYSTTCGDITIGGTADITAVGHRNGSGIGSGGGIWEDKSICGDITIGGHAKVYASGSAAIGTYYIGKCGNITIGEDAYVIAKGENYSPGIGCGNSLTWCKAITISGGTVIATGSVYSPAIGTCCSDRVSCESITITGGAIVATGGADSPAIGSGPENIEDVPIVITSGIESLTATRGSDIADYIGAGEDSVPCSVTIDGVENATPESTFQHFNSSVNGRCWTLTKK